MGLTLPSIQLILFDIDDTLVATASMERYARKCALEALEVPIEINAGLDAWLRLYWYFGSVEVREMLQLVQIEVLGHSIATPLALDRACMEFDARFWDGLAPSAGAVEVLATLRDLGMALGIMSNGVHEYQLQKLTNCGLTPFFSSELILVAAPGSLLSKPRPQGILEVVNSAAKEPTHAVYVGDRLADMVAAHLAGVAAAIRFNGSSIEAVEPEVPLTSLEAPDFTISVLSELPTVLNEFAKTPVSSGPFRLHQHLQTQRAFTE